MSDRNTTILNSQVRDSSSKLIFDDPTLCSQFLRDYVSHIPCLREVQPEDIEDVSEQYVPLFSEERNADRVKKVHNKNDVPFFLISLIEHKTKVEYTVCMQIFRYMIYIWEDYEKEAERQQSGITRTKDFRYPPILPIVYYEGREKWTVPLDFKSRIMGGETFAKYIPDFQYHLVPLCDYSNRELLDRQDEISLVMLINKIQDADVLKALLLKMNISHDEAEEIVGKVRKKDMGELFENMEPIDIQAERRKWKKQREELKEQQEELKGQQEELKEQQKELKIEREAMAVERKQMQAQIEQLQAELKALRQNL